MKDHLHPAGRLGNLGRNPSSSASTLEGGWGGGGVCNLGNARIFPCFCHTVACPLSASAPCCVLGVFIINAAGQELLFPVCPPHRISCDGALGCSHRKK